MTIAPLGPDHLPRLASRVVTIEGYGLGEDIPQDGIVTFRVTTGEGCPTDLHDTLDGRLLTATPRAVQLVDGKGEVRLPVYDAAVQTQDGSSDWVIAVHRSWSGTSSMIRVPAGTTPIPLASIPPVERGV